MGPFDFVNTAFFDTSGNDFAEPRDALLVINFLNASAESVRAGPAARPILVTGDTLPLGQLTPALFVEQQRKTSDNEQDLAAEGEALLPTAGAFDLYRSTSAQDRSASRSVHEAVFAEPLDDALEEFVDEIGALWQDNAADD